MMRIALIALAACGTAAEPAKPPFAPPPLVIKEPVADKRVIVSRPAAPKAGDTVTIARDEKIVGQLRKGEVTAGWDSVESWVVDVEWLDDSKRRATIRDHRRTERDDAGRVKSAGLTLRGNQYLIDGEMVAREDGRAMTADEESKLRSLVVDRTTPIDDAILGKPIESRGPIPLPLAATAASIAPGVTLHTAELRLLDVRGDVAMIEVHLVGSVPGGAGGSRAFESRDRSEWSIARGLVTRLDSAATFTGREGEGIESWNRLDGSLSYRYGG